MKPPVITPMSVAKELAGVPYIIVYTPTFIDHKSEPAAVMNRRFASVDAIKVKLHEMTKEAKVYIYTLSQYDFECPTEPDGKRIEYWLRCAYRRI